MTHHLIAAIDQGTTNTKASLIDAGGRVLREASRSVAVRYPQPGWVEQDAWELWQTSREALAEILDGVGTAGRVTLAVTNQRESVLVWDRRTGEPAGPCAIWQCHRSAPFCQELIAQGLEPLIRERTGLTIDPMFSASKARWLLDHIPDGRQRAEQGDLCVGTVDSWLLWNLTGGAVHACDVTNASRTQLLNLKRLEWDDELLDLFGIPRACLPAVLPSSHIYGETVALDGVRGGMTIGSLIGDSHAALYGHAGFHPGSVKATYGTGSSLMTPTPSPIPSAHGLSATVAWGHTGRATYASEGNIYATGAAVDWLMQLLGTSEAEAIERQAREVADTGGVYFVPALVGLGAPHWSDSARGLICGLTRGATAGHLARATLEAIAYQIRDVFDAMQQDVGALSVLHADGGPTRNEFLMQFQADVLGVPVLRSLAGDVSALGAAYLAGLATCVWACEDEIAELPRATVRYEPRMAESIRETLYEGWRQAIARTLFGTQRHGAN